MTDWLLATSTGWPMGWGDARLRAEVAPLLETVGAVEAELLLLAKNNRTHTLCLRHDRESNRQRMAARRLVARGLLAAPNYMPGKTRFPADVQDRGGLYFYALTPRGASCWLRYPKPKKES
jgi:hypothetical protein